MRKKRRWLAFFMLVAAVGVSGFILQDSLGRQITFGFADITEKTPVEAVLGSLKLNSERIDANLTDIFSQLLAETIFKNNAKLLSGAGDSSTPIQIPDETELNQWLSEQIKHFDHNSLKPEVLDQALKTIPVAPGQEEQMVRNWTEQLQQILDKNFGVLAWDGNFDYQKAKPEEYARIFKNLALQHSQAIKELYNLAGPADVIAFQKEEIRLLGARQRVYEALGNFESDPLKALLISSANNKITEGLKVLLENLLSWAKQKNINLE